MVLKRVVSADGHGEMVGRGYFFALSCVPRMVSLQHLAESKMVANGPLLLPQGHSKLKKEYRTSDM